MKLTLEERAPIYGLIARLLVREVDPAMWEVLRSDVFVGFLESGAPDCAAAIAEASETAPFDALAEEFARLFLMPGGLSPRASAWMDGDREQLVSRCAASTAPILESLGRSVVVAEPWGRLPPDHLACLLDLTIAAADAGGDRKRTGEQIVREWIDPWVGQFGTALERRAETAVYRAVGSILSDLH